MRQVVTFSERQGQLRTWPTRQTGSNAVQYVAAQHVEPTAFASHVLMGCSAHDSLCRAMSNWRGLLQRAKCTLLAAE
jgi:hypothetical protein